MYDSLSFLLHDFLYFLITNSTSHFLDKMNNIGDRDDQSLDDLECMISSSFLASREEFTELEEFDEVLKTSEQIEKEQLMKKQLAKAKLIHKWKYRYNYFTLFDSGIQMDLESWYSVTPEVILKLR
ncbi:Trimethylguanosine synthase [Thelohanellus kitauei]|uniref:Trimethylguanosine synthase n=1 Tax=Thelohanellus kitauei TaxID=669202 RepID=A0A0C2J709_THEKT|nr:Trimethylguanosine synthase [Thelohanellus kitauei]